jgi:hypothetical protein
MEVDVKRRRDAPWAAPVPSDAGKIRHLSAASDHALRSGVCRERRLSLSSVTVWSDEQKEAASRLSRIVEEKIWVIRLRSRISTASCGQDAGAAEAIRSLEGGATS